MTLNAFSILRGGFMTDAELIEVSKSIESGMPDRSGSKLGFRGSGDSRDEGGSSVSGQVAWSSTVGDCAVSDEPARSVGRLLRKLRRDAELSQAELAKSIGVDTSYISKLEKGLIPNPSDVVVTGLAEVLRIPYDDLVMRFGIFAEDMWKRMAVNPRLRAVLRAVIDSRLTNADMDELLVWLNRRCAHQGRKMYHD